MHITDLPEEILDRAVASLDSPNDLRNLAAVCSQFHSLVEPYHTQFRIIRAPLISPLWQKLAGSQLLAQNVRILEVQPGEVDEYSALYGLDAPVVPAIFSDLEVPSVPEMPDADSDQEDTAAVKAYDKAKNAMDLEAERVLVSALKGMSGLTSFQWKRTPPLINPTQEDDIWITLAKYCPSLNSIDVIDPYKSSYAEEDDPAYQRPTLNPNFYSFKDLKLFSLKTVAFQVRGSAIPSLEQGAEMLVKNCPMLEILRLQYVILTNPHARTVNATPLLSNASWVSLRELTLLRLNFISAELAAFLVSHPTIEVLSLMSVQVDEPLVLPAGVLPRLKTLSAGSAVIDSILNSPTSLPRPLEGILGVSLNGVFLDKLENSGSGTTLKELRCRCESDDDLSHLITRLSGIAPNLECLHMTGFDTRVPVDRHMYPVFGQLPYLRTLTGVWFIGSTTTSENTEILRALVAICPNLRRINWYLGDHYDLDSIVAIERNGSHVSWHLLKAWDGKEGQINTNWGDMGHGSFEL